MATTQLGFGSAPGLVSVALRTGAMAGAAAIALATGPAAAADPPACLPLNGTQLHANSVLDTHILGVVYTTNVDYWYAGGAVNWHKTVDGGAFNAVHLDTSGATPAGPGSVVSIPGATPDGATTAPDSYPVIVPIPITATVCSR